MRQAQVIAVGIVTGLVLLLAIALPLRSAESGAASCACAQTANLNLNFKDIQGKSFALSDYKGKVVLLDFWATWCPPCRKEIPGFIEMYNSYRSRGFVVIGVSMDDSTSDIKKFAKRYKMNYPILLGAGRNDLEPAFGQLPLPTAFVIGRDGRICAKHDGLTPKEDFEREIVPLLEVE
jgi:peroxiredoxin